jgi:hypothetical protein
MELVSLKSLIFNSYDDHAELIVEMRKESLSYFVTYTIHVLYINQIMNLLQKNNSEIDLNESIISTDYEEFQEFNIDFTKIENSYLNFDEVEFMVVNSFKKQIRA